MSKTVAIIDDDAVLLEMLTTVLEDEGYHVKTFSHTVFVDVLEKNSFNILLLDVWFDNSRAGIQMAQALRTRQGLTGTPVVMMSSDPNLKEYATKAGITNYLSKPINFDALLTVVDQLSTCVEETKQPYQESATYTQNLEQT